MNSNMEYRHFLINNAKNIINNNSNNLNCNSNLINFDSINNNHVNTNNIISNNNTTFQLPLMFSSILTPPLQHNSDLKDDYFKKYLESATKNSLEIKFLNN